MTGSPGKASAALLCGGGSGRLRFPKEMLRVDGVPLAVRVVERLKREFPSVSVITNRPGFLWHHLDVPICPDVFEAVGPLAGLHAALRWSPEDMCFCLACDMPLIHEGIMRRVVQKAQRTNAPAVVPIVDGHAQPVCAVYSKRLLPRLERFLTDGRRLAMNAFLDDIGPEFIEMASEDCECFQDIDGIGDLELLNQAFDEVEPLPVREVLLEAGTRATDVVAEEWPVALYVNSIKLVTVLCLPTALRELALGITAYLGLIENLKSVDPPTVDYWAKLISLDVAASDEQVTGAVQQLVTSACGGNVYGSPALLPPHKHKSPEFRVAASHLLEGLSALRSMSPVFSVTGGTHQAAFSDGRSVRLFFEDIGRHNAIDKVVGRALMDGVDLSQGVLITTGRVSSEMVVKAARSGVPVLASRSAATSHAIRLAQQYGITLAGFARGNRLNVYTEPHRVVLDELGPRMKA